MASRGPAARRSTRVRCLVCAARAYRCADGIGGRRAPVAAIERRDRGAACRSQSEDGLEPREIQREVQARMSDHAGFLCSADGVSEALGGARALNARIRAEGVRMARADQADKAPQWRQMALCSEAVLTALDAYIAAGGGSRGARAFCDAQGEATPQSRLGPLEDYRFRIESEADRARQIFVRREGEGFACEVRSIRRRDRARRSYFERDWPAFLSGGIYREG